MKKIIFGTILGLTFLVISCDKPSNEQEVVPSNRYSFQSIESGGTVLVYVFDGKTGDVFVRTGDSKWWNISGIKTAQKGQ